MSQLSGLIWVNCILFKVHSIWNFYPALTLWPTRIHRFHSAQIFSHCFDVLPRCFDLLLFCFFEVNHFFPSSLLSFIFLVSQIFNVWAFGMLPFAAVWLRSAQQLELSSGSEGWCIWSPVESRLMFFSVQMKVPPLNDVRTIQCTPGSCCLCLASYW